jgi:NADH-quinone oxidoreductase subunit G
MAIRTDSKMVRECRQGVMEFLLINHPLDCPICDQAGECRLQEFSVEYGNASSRFLDRKVKKPKNVELGPRVTLDAERCVLCSRCIRFMKEVANDDVLGFVDRGSYSTIACHPERVLDNNYSLNTVDICPVGALTSSDFRFKMRVWFLKETKTIDINDGLGANITVGSRQEQVYRITPRENNDVNGVWLPDSHRLNFKYVNSPERLTQPAVKGEPVGWPQAVSIAAQVLKAAAPGTLAMIASARMTNEELFLAKRLAAVLGITQFDVVPRRGEPDGIMIVADRNPNTRGAKLLGVAAEEDGARLKEIVAGVRSGAIKSLIVLHEDLLQYEMCGLTAADVARLDALVVVGMLANRTTSRAAVTLPGSAWVEKRGSMINVNGRLQRLNRAVAAPGEARDDWEILRDLIVAVGGSNGLALIEDVFKQMSTGVKEIEGLNLSKIGDLGVQVLERGQA